MNLEEEYLEEEVADYRKGEGQIIVEEFLVTLLDLPGALQYLLFIAPLNFVTSYLALPLGWLYHSVIKPR